MNMKLNLLFATAHTITVPREVQWKEYNSDDELYS